MMVEHTHDDIDQLFSRFSVGMKKGADIIFSTEVFFQVFESLLKPSCNLL